MSTSARKDLPAPSSGNWPALMNTFARTYLGLTGNPLDRGITLGDLQAAGLATGTFAGGRFVGLKPGASVGGGGGTSPGNGGGTDPTDEVDLTPPPQATGLKVSASFAHLFIEHDVATYTQGHGHDRTILYAASYAKEDPLPTFADAKELAQFQGNVSSVPVPLGVRYRLWIKWQSVDGVKSIDPAGGTNGVLGQTGLINGVDLADNIVTAAKLAAGAVDALDKFAPGLQPVGNVDTLPPLAGYAGPKLVYLVPAGKLYRLVNGAWTKAVDGADLLVGTVGTNQLTAGAVTAGKIAARSIVAGDGVIDTAAIANAMIQNLAVDNAKIASVSVDKLLAGSIAVGQYIQSSNFVSAGLGSGAGFRLTAAGVLEATNAIIRGTVYVGGGAVGGILVGANFIQSSNFNEATKTGFYLGADGTLRLPGGSVTADTLNIGFGGNLIPNSAWVEKQQGSNVPVGWNFGFSPMVATCELGTNFASSFPPGARENGLWLNQDNSYGGTDSYALLETNPIPVVAGRRYEFSVYAGSARCLTITQLDWFDYNGQYISSSRDGAVSSSNDYAYGTLSQFKRIGNFGYAPGNASSVRARIIKYGRIDTNNSNSNTVAFMLYPMLGMAGAGQTTFSQYNPSGLGTLITPKGINTPSIAAINAVLGNVYAGSIRGGSFQDWIWPTDGGSGFYLGPEGLKLGNYYANRYVHIGQEGNFYIPGMKSENGTLTVAAVNVINTLNIAGNAVTVPQFASAGRQENIYPGGSATPDYADCRMSGYDSQGSMTYFTINFTVTETYNDGTPGGGD